MRIAIYGTGSLGGYFGAKLALAGNDVHFIARGKQLAAIQSNGITLDGADEQFTLHPVQATDNPAEIGPVDAVLVGVKTWQVEDVAARLGPLLEPHTRVLTLQNGVEAPGYIAQQIGPQRVLGGVCRGFFFLEAPGKIRHVGVQPSIIFGQIDNTQTPETKNVLAALQGAGIHSSIAPDIQVALWEKFLMVTALSGVGAVTRSPIGPIRDHPPTRRMLTDAMAEIFAVAMGHQVKLKPDFLESCLTFIETFPPEATTSMQRDWQDGYPSELDAQTGAVVRLGQAAGVETPLNEFIYNSLILNERKARGT
ncbi:MAG: 2-dehydropantoate 2-reductase [Anaerolineae bacterium]|nr:2-dehydropantoate 2-reductase [Anaerolineae bacterium]MCB0222506.1 2-dehydropantoate 2-reductase [Anaerolineae bacterium]MCB9105262.1 2-dehydropantoate 2-reductase [Anaerolineales bacterium]